LLTFKTSLREEEIISPIYAYTSIGATDSPSNVLMPIMQKPKLFTIFVKGARNQFNKSLM
jgi:hypothetical protein